jgi:RNA polymerase sigma-70 factor (ECF subfamily)
MRDQDRSDSELLRAARRDPEALGVFYDRWERPVFAFLIRRCGQPDVAAELAAETWAAVVLECHRGVRVSKAGGWLFTIANSKLADHIRRQRIDERARRRARLERVEFSDATLERIAEIGSDPRVDALHQALEELPADQHAAVMARVVGERGYDEIADDINTNEGLARQRVSRGLRRLRKRIEEVEE